MEKHRFEFTWRHEVVIEAETKEQAKQIWESISLGKLDQEVADGEIYSHWKSNPLSSSLVIQTAE